MANEENRFESEVLPMLSALIVKVDENSEGISLMRGEVKTLSGQISQVGLKVIEINNRLAKVEEKFGSIDTRLTALEVEAKQIRFELADLNRKIEAGFNVNAKVKDLDSRIEKLEEKVFA